MPSLDADRNLLFGIFAVQLGYVPREVLISTMSECASGEPGSIVAILDERGCLAPADREHLESVVERHVRRHDGDLGRSLEAVGAASSVLSDLRRTVAGPGSRGSRGLAGPTRADDAYATRIPEPDDVARSPDRGEPIHRPRYRKLRDHARGGLGVVYVAHDNELNREVALKEIHEHRADNPESRARFLREAEVTGGLEHPGIVPVYGLGRYPDGRPFYAMRFIKGDSLKDAIGTFHRAESPDRDPGERMLELQKLLRRFLDVCDAIDYAHSRGVLHRDLKPDNIMVGRYGETLVVDWGLAKATGLPGDNDLAPSESTLSPSMDDEAAATHSGTALGSPPYMPPEQAAGRLDLLGPASDVYSLGATLYALLSGKAPVVGEEIGEILRRVQSGEFPRPREASPWLDPALEAICLRAMALRPSDRYATPRALAADLELWLADEPVSAHREALGARLARWSRRHRAWVIAGIATMTAVAVTAVAALLMINGARNREADQRREAEAQHRVANERALEAESSRRAAQRTTVKLLGLAIERGTNLCESGEIGQGLLWFARCLELVPEDDDGELQWAIRAKLAGWRSSLTSLDRVIRHPHEVNVARFSPDGTKILTGMGLYYSATPHAAQLWDAATGVPAGPPLPHGLAVMDVAFSPDGRALFTGSMDGRLRVWDAATGEPRHDPWTFGPRGARDIAVRPDGRALATTAGANWTSVRIVDVATGRQIGPALAHEDEVMDIDWSDDGRRLLTAGKDRKVRVWDGSTGEPIGPPLLHPNHVYGAAFSPDGKSIVAGGVDFEAHLWDVASGKEIKTPVRHRAGIFCVAFCPDGVLAATGSADGQVRLWDVGTGRIVGPPLSHGSAVWSVQFSPDGRTLLTGSEDAKARLWKLPLGNVSRRLAPEHRSARAVAVGPDGASLLVACSDHVVRLDRSTGSQIGPAVRHPATIARVLVRPDGRAFLTVGGDTARLWDAASGLPFPGAATIRLPGLGAFSGIMSAAFSPDGKTFATGGQDRKLRLWDAATCLPVGPVMAESDMICALAFAPDGRSLAAGTWSGRVSLLSTTDGRPIGPTIRHGNQLTDLAYHPAGRMLVTGSQDGTGRLWDVRTGRPIGPVLQHRLAISRVAFGAGGRLVATASQDETVRLWDVATGTPLGPPIECSGPVGDLAISPDSRSILTADAGGDALAWRLPALPEAAPRRVTAWAQSATGQVLDEGGAVRPMDADEWEGARLATNEAETPPFPAEESADVLVDDALGRAGAAAGSGMDFACRWQLRRSSSYPSEAGSGPSRAREAASILQRLGNVLGSRGDLEGALAALREATLLLPDDPQVHHDLGRALAARGHPWRPPVSGVGARSILAAGHRLLGSTLRAAGRPEDAAEVIRRAIRLDPDLAEAHLALEEVLRQQALRADLGARCRDVLLSRSGGDGPPLAALLKSLKALAATKPLIPCLIDAARRHPDDAEAQMSLAIALQAVGDPARAASAYREVVRLMPDSLEASLASTLEADGKRDDAIAAYRNAVRLDPDSARLHRLLGRMLEDKGDLDGAIASLREVIRLEPKGADAHCSLAALLIRKGEFAAAIAPSRESIRLAPSPEAYTNLSVSLGGTGDTAGATAALREAFRLKFNPSKSPATGRRP